MKPLARHYALLKLIKNYGWQFAQTNAWEGSKAHFLQLRKEGLVGYESGRHPRVSRVNRSRPYGADRNAYFYAISIQGLQLLKKLFPEEEAPKDMLREIVEYVLMNQKYWIEEFKHRNLEGKQ